MMQVRKKVDVPTRQAWQWDGSDAVLDELEKAGAKPVVLDGTTEVQIQTLRGATKVAIGEFVLKAELPGDFYPCDAETFDKTYEHVDSSRALAIDKKLQAEDAAADAQSTPPMVGANPGTPAP